jgi:ligand-binding SRPBCC domain-containing protein
MPIIKIEVAINAPIERVFDLARCIDLHAETMRKNKEKAVAGRVKGLIELNESVTWEAMHFGVRQKLTSKITEFERPRHFRDVMQNGSFKHFTHDHYFEEINGGEEKVMMRDIFDYESPFGIFGRIADALFLERYMKRILTERNLLIKEAAEGDGWRKFLD